MRVGEKEREEDVVIFIIIPKAMEEGVERGGHGILVSGGERGRNEASYSSLMWTWHF